MITSFYTWLLISSAQMCVDADYRKPCQQWAYQCLLDQITNNPKIDNDTAWEICSEDNHILSFYKGSETWDGQFE